MGDYHSDACAAVIKVCVLGLAALFFYHYLTGEGGFQGSPEYRLRDATSVVDARPARPRPGRNRVITVPSPHQAPRGFEISTAEEPR
jgi:hypothetical protein